MLAQEHLAFYAVVGLLVAFLGSTLPRFLFAGYSFLAHSVLLCYVVVVLADFLVERLLRWRIDGKDKAVLITGCDSGFGNGLAAKLDEVGFKVFACCLNPAGDGAQGLKALGSGKLQVVGLDVREDASVSKALAYVKENLGSSELWAIVNNAGVCETFLIEMTSVKAFDFCYQVNAQGMVRVTKAFLPLLRKSRGRVVNVCSMAGRLPTYFATAYTMSKFAAVAFTESLRLDMQDFGVDVISIEPEYFKTRMCSEESIRSTTQSNIEASDPLICEDYGEEYIKKSQDCFIQVNEGACGEVQYVVDAMENAVCRRWPRAAYVPNRGLVTYAVFYAMQRINTEVKAVLIHSLFGVLGLGDPKTAKGSFRSALRKFCSSVAKNLSGS